MDTMRAFSNDTANKIRLFANLPNEWHFGVGRAPSSTMISKALAWHDKLRHSGFAITDAFPGAMGDIMVTGYQGAHYVEILLETDATVSFVYEREGDEVNCLDHVAPDQVSKVLEGIAGAIWSTSDYFTRTTSTASAMSSRAWHSRFMMTVLPSSNSIASSELEVVSATMPKNFIPPSVGNPPYFGFLTKASFLKIPA